MPSTTTTATADQATIATICNSLPAYVTVRLVTDDAREYECLTRDLPTRDPLRPRRLTCITTGSEWFISADGLARMRVVSMTIPPQEIALHVGPF